MRLVIFINKFGIGGAERLVIDEVHELVRRGIDVTVITLREDREESDQSLGSPSLDIHSVFFSSLFDVSAWVTLIRVLSDRRFDVALTHLWFANTIGRIAAYVAGVPRIYAFEHNVYDRVKTWKQFLIDRILQSLSSGIIAVSPAVRNSLIAHGVTEERIVVVPNGIDVSRFRKEEEHAPNPFFTFLFVGRLVEQKGVDVLLEAFGKLDHAELHIVGDGTLKNDLEKKARMLPGSRIEFLGTRRDVPALLSRADCFVFPSRWEGYGLAIAEAAATGLPIIASDVPAVRDLVEHEKEAILVPPGDAAALSIAMQRVMGDHALRQRLARAARERATHFSIERHIDGLLQIIQLQ
ncbi:glycosyltransferase [Candidatus Parcubacteria bacterium]|nr:MAG: glycosyltransferase [Candidatus Parcubacteria bacterium]